MGKTKSICSFCNIEFFHGPSSEGKYCSNKCQRKLASSVYLHKLKNGGFIGKEMDRATIYRHLVNEKGNKCEICGITDWNNKPIRLWVDHIDGSAANNIWSNLRLICPNCDSQLDTCRAKNKGKGRKALGLKF